MKKALLALMVLLGVGTVAHAQEPPRFGLVGGLQSSSLRSTVSTNGLFGVHIGGMAELSLTDNIVIRPQLLYSLKGGSEDGLTVRLSYLELPVHAVYKTEVGSGKLFGGLGPYLGFMVSGRVSDGVDSEALTIGDDIKGFDAGLSLMGGYELTEQKLSVNLFYNTGFANLNPGSSSTTKTTNGTFGLSVAYFLGQQ